MSDQKIASRVWGYMNEKADEDSEPAPQEQDEPSYKPWSKESAIRTTQGGIYNDALRPAMERLGTETGISKGDAEQVQKGMAGVFFDLNVSPDKAQRLAGLFAGYATGAPDESQVHEWETESRKMMRSRFGDESESLLAASRSYVERHPELKRMLGPTGLGSHPDYVIEIAERVQQIKKREQFKP